MELCRSVFWANLDSVMTRPGRCVVASGPGRFPPVRAAHIGLLLAKKINKLGSQGGTTPWLSQSNTPLKT